MSALLVLLVLQSAPAAAPVADVENASAPTASSALDRRMGVHLGLNATAAFDAELGERFYGQIATQLTGLGNIVAPREGLVLSAFVMAGVTLPLMERPGSRLNLDVGPHLTLLRSYPVNLMAGGVVAGLRWVFANGLTLGLKLPIAGYAGSLNEPRGSVLYYYVAAVPTVPLLSVGYSF